jgi:N-acyl-D-amino-acid deacylase
VRDLATFEKPNQLSEGMQYVLVNGVPVIEGGKVTNALPGKVLRGPGYVRNDTTELRKSPRNY